MDRWQIFHICLSRLIVIAMVLSYAATFAASADSPFRALSRAEAIALLPDGKIIATGSAPSVIDGVQYGGVSVARYNPDGSLDPSFGVGGVVSVPVRVSAPRGGAEGANTLAVQDDGKFVVAGSSGDGFAVVRYNPDGSLDSTFGQDGTVVTTITPGARCCGSQAYALALQPDSKIVAAGVSALYFALVRYNPNGTLESNFSVDGKAMPQDHLSGESPLRPSCGYEEAIALLAQKDGKILVAGTSAGKATLLRFNPEGSLDTSFGLKGNVITGLGAESIAAFALALQSDGKIVAVGRSSFNSGLSSEFSLIRYNPDGRLDQSFGVRGIVTTRIGNAGSAASDVIVQPDGKVVVVGISYDDRDNTRNMSIVAVRYAADGSLDPIFGTGGKIVTPIASGERPPYVQPPSRSGTKVILQPDGKIAVVSNLERHFTVFRYTTEGNVDTDFGKDGKATIPIGAAGDSAGALALQPDGKLVVAGACSNRRHTNIALVRYDSEGYLDTSFGRGGKVTSRVGAGYTVW